MTVIILYTDPVLLYLRHDLRRAIHFYQVLAHERPRWYEQAR